MRLPGAIYKNGSREFLAVYSFHNDVIYQLPGKFAGVRPIAHFSYSRGNKEGGVVVYLISPRETAEFVDIKKEIVAPQQFRWELRRYNVSGEIVGGESERYGFRHGLIGAVLRDIADFCGDQKSKKDSSTGITSVDKIIPRTAIKRIRPERVLTSGKQEFVDSCAFEANIDFGKGCLSGWIPSEGASFDGETFTNYFSFPWGECGYCYASRQHKSFPKSVYIFDKERLLEELKGGCELEYGTGKKLGRPVRVLRFGKRTESWTPFTQDAFIGTLEAMTETGTRGVIPTKFLPFSSEVAELLKRTNSTVLYSTGFDELEPGAVAYGATNQFRLEQAKLFSEAGVNTRLYLLAAAHLAPGEREKTVLEFAEKLKIPVQVLPMRFKGKDLVQRVTGEDWDNLCDVPQTQPLLFPELEIPYRGTYRKGPNHDLIVSQMHPEWRQIIGNNKGKVRMCHHNDSEVYCGGCGVKEGFCSLGRKHI